MKTGSWQTIGAAPGRVGISLGSPRGQPAGYKLYRPLAPTRDMLSMGLAQYEPLYLEQLSRLDPKQVWDDIHILAMKAAGADVEPVILCFETAPFTKTNFCHRRLAARWLEDALGHKIPELGFEDRDVDYSGFRQPSLAL